LSSLSGRNLPSLGVQIPSSANGVASALDQGITSTNTAITPVVKQLPKNATVTDLQTEVNGVTTTEVVLSPLYESELQNEGLPVPNIPASAISGAIQTGPGNITEPNPTGDVTLVNQVLANPSGR
jgi:hypothetical protein